MKHVTVYVLEVAEALGLSRGVAWRRMRRGDFGSVRQLPGGGKMFVLREDFLNALDRMVIEEPTEQPRRKPRRQGLPKVPVELAQFMGRKPGGQKRTAPNGRTA